MDIAIVLTEEDTAKVLNGDDVLIQAIRVIAKDKDIITVLGKDDDGALYDITSECLP